MVLVLVLVWFACPCQRRHRDRALHHCCYYSTSTGLHDQPGPSHYTEMATARWLAGRQAVLRLHGYISVWLALQLSHSDVGGVGAWRCCKGVVPSHSHLLHNPFHNLFQHSGSSTVWLENHPQ